MEKSKRSEARLIAHMKPGDDFGMNGDSNLNHLSQSVRFSKQGKQSRDDDTN